MSLDAIIHAVEFPGDGTAILRMRNGERSLTVLNPPKGHLIEAVVGERIKIAANAVYINGIVWAKRKGYCTVELIRRAR